MKPLAILNRQAFTPDDQTKVDTWLRTAGYDVVHAVGGTPVTVVAFPDDSASHLEDIASELRIIRSNS